VRPRGLVDSPRVTTGNEADLTGADLTGTTLVDPQGRAIYGPSTTLPAGFDAQSYEWIYVVPEPATLLLALLALAAVPLRVRHG